MGTCRSTAILGIVLSTVPIQLLAQTPPPAPASAPASEAAGPSPAASASEAADSAWSHPPTPLSPTARSPLWHRAQQEKATHLEWTAYDAGTDVGTGVPLVVYGSVFSAFGLLLVVSASGSSGNEDSEGDDFSDTDFREVVQGIGLMLTAIGLAQLIPGAILISEGRSGDARHLTQRGQMAYDAGYDHGVGRTFVVYGAVHLLSLLSLLGDSEGGGTSIVAPVAHGAFEVVYGAYHWQSGQADFAAMRAHPLPPQASRGPPPPRVLPVTRLHF